MNADPEQRLAEALRAQASGAGTTGRPWQPPTGRRSAGIVPVLLLALLGGAVLGVALALVTLLAPGTG